MTDQIWAMEEVGFSYHAFGDFVDTDGASIEYFKGDKLTPEQKSKLKTKLGDKVRFFTAKAQYAPESTKPVIGFVV